MAPWPGGATDYIKNKVTTKRKTHWLEQDPLIRTPPYGPCRMQLYSYRAWWGSWQFGARREPANNGTLACWKDALSGSVRVESYKHKKLCDKRNELTGELASTAVVRGFQGVTITTKTAISKRKLMKHLKRDQPGWGFGANWPVAVHALILTWFLVTRIRREIIEKWLRDLGNS